MNRFAKWFSRTLSGNAVPKRKPRTINRTQLQLENLEDRCLLSGLQINPRSPITVLSRLPSLNGGTPPELDLFTTGPDGHVYTNSHSDGGADWQSQWQVIDPNFSLIPGSKIAAVSRTPTHIDLFAAGNDGHVWSTYWDNPPNDPTLGHWAAWFQLPSNSANASFFPGSPISAVSRGGTHLDIYAVATDGQVRTDRWDQSQNNGQWQPWVQVGTDLNGFATGTTVTAISHLPDTITLDPTTTNVDLFAVDRAGNVMWASSAPAGKGPGGSYLYSYGNWSQTGAVAAGVSNTTVIGATYRRPSSIYDFEDVNIFLIGKDGLVYGNWRNPSLNGGLWHTWSVVSATQQNSSQSGNSHAFGAASVAVTARTPTHMDIFIVDNAGDVITDSWDEKSVLQPAGAWQTWTPVDQVIDANGLHTLNSAASVVTAVNRGPSHLDLFLISYDGRAMSDSWDQNANSGNWNTWYRIGDHTQVFPVGPIYSSSTPDWFATNIPMLPMATLARDFAAEGGVDRNQMLSQLYMVEFYPYGIGFGPWDVGPLNAMLSNPGSCRLTNVAADLEQKVLDDLGLNFNIPAWAKTINDVFFGKALPDTRYDTGAKDADGWEIWLQPAYQTVTGELFGPGGPSFTDVRQGGIGDCWLLASLAEVAARRPEDIQSMFLNNYDGTYTVRFFNGSTPDFVTVDSELPQYGFDGLVSGSDGNTILWVALAEKAYAQENAAGWLPCNNPGINSYQALSWLNDSKIPSVIPALTGLPEDPSLPLKLNPGSLTNAWQAGQLILLGTGDMGNWPQWITDKNNNTVTLVSSHVYAVVGYDSSSQQFTVFNPWGVNGGIEKLPDGTLVYCGGIVIGTAQQFADKFDYGTTAGFPAVQRSKTGEWMGEILVGGSIGDSVGLMPAAQPKFRSSSQGERTQQSSQRAVPLQQLDATDEIFTALRFDTKREPALQTTDSLFELAEIGIDCLFARAF
jgi:hypothetical protein